MEQYRIGDKVRIKTQTELAGCLDETLTGNYACPKTGVIFMESMLKSCGQVKTIKNIRIWKGIRLYYFGPAPRMDYAYVESFIKGKE